jgi:nucleoside-diphosphate-sugar epimerase
MGRVVVTGATSFIGVHLVRALLSAGSDVTAVVRPNTAKNDLLLPENANLKYLELDLNEYSHLHEYLIETPDIYFSLAWNGTRGMDRDDFNLQSMNYKYSIQGLESILKTGCRRVITAGSQAQYGLYSGRITEETAEKPVTQYGIHKLKFYNEATEICSAVGASLKEPRFFSLYGPLDSDKTMIVSLIKSMLKGESCNLTLGVQKWDFLYISDAIDALLCLAHKPCADGVYNLGSGISKPLKEYVYEIRDILDSKSELIFGAIPYPTTGMVSIEPDISKIKEQTGWAPKIPFGKGILEVTKAIQVRSY